MKDAKGHGSNKRGGGSGKMAKVSVDPSKLGFRMADIGPGGKEHNVVTGGAAMPNYSNPTPTPYNKNYATAELGGAHAVAAAHGIPTDHLAPAPTQRVNTNAGPYKVQSLDTNRTGQPWATQRSFRNNTVAERVALRMAADGGHMRVKVR